MTLIQRFSLIWPDLVSPALLSFCRRSSAHCAYPMLFSFALLFIVFCPWILNFIFAFFLYATGLENVPNNFKWGIDLFPLVLWEIPFVTRRSTLDDSNLAIFFPLLFRLLHFRLFLLLLSLGRFSQRLKPFWDSLIKRRTLKSSSCYSGVPKRWQK